MPSFKFHQNLSRGSKICVHNTDGEIDTDWGVKWQKLLKILSILTSVVHVTIVTFNSILIATNSITEVPVKRTPHSVHLASCLCHLEQCTTESMKINHSWIKNLRNYLFFEILPQDLKQCKIVMGMSLKDKMFSTKLCKINDPKGAMQQVAFPVSTQTS